jgi:hypothetical protein
MPSCRTIMRNRRIRAARGEQLGPATLADLVLPPAPVDELQPEAEEPEPDTTKPAKGRKDK